MAAPQFLYGDANEVKATIATAKAVDSGDLVGMAAGTLVRAEDETWVNGLATTQANFVEKFLGASQQTKDASTARIRGNSEDNVVVVSTAGVFEFDCASATFEVGDLVGPAQDGVEELLLSDKVVAVSAAACAVGRVVQRGTSITRVKVQLMSRLMPLAMPAVGGAEVVTGAKTITHAENGRTFYLNAAGGGAITLPAVALGLQYRIVIGVTPPTTAWVISTASSANVVQGQVHSVPEDDAGLRADNEDTITFVANQALEGDFIDLRSDGTNWYVSGSINVLEALTFTVAS